jgi:carboxyl-terminal processing protease
VAKYESPSGKKLQDDGVTPGVLVASATAGQGDGDGDETPQVMGATPAPAVTAKPAATVDEQLTKALDLLKAKAA